VKKEDTSVPPLRGFLLDGEFFIGSVLATTLTKLGLKFTKLSDDSRKQNAFLAECMMIMTSILHLGRSGYAKKQIPEDDFTRISACVKVLSDPSAVITQIFAEESRKALCALLATKGDPSKEKKVEKKKSVAQPDEPIAFAQLMIRDGSDALEDELQKSLMAAVSGGPTAEKADPLQSKLNKVEQLTGFSDPVYAEAYVNVNQYDIVLDVLVVNQTADTLQSVTLELATLGDLKLVEKPFPITLAPHDFANIKASVKVTSTENAIIFGNIVYDMSGNADRNCGCVVLNDIKIDIMDYIQPAMCTDQEFREMWAGFEWENKVTVHTNIDNLRDYLHHLVTSTNMKCLTPEKTLTGDCEFLAANLYARSMFGESALANLSIEVGSNGFVQGHIRIRAKSQGMAISLGDKINESQKKAS
jgi:coatomer subunit beta